jgi:hypothetical protein
VDKFGVNWVGAETFDLDVNNNDTKKRIYFLKSYCQRHIYENFLKKRLKIKKSGPCTGWASEGLDGSRRDTGKLIKYNLCFKICAIF